MRLLLDTHIMLWWQLDHPHLSNTAKELINSAQHVYFSQASLWEMAIKISMGRLQINMQDFSNQIIEQGFEWLPLKNEHLMAVAKLPIFDDHKDPFDRLLVAQSHEEPLQLLTADKHLLRYGVMVRVV